MATLTSLYLCSRTVYAAVGSPTAGGASITIQFTSYNASTGELLFNANSSQVIDIPTYIRSLQNCGAFSTVSYTGYTADDNGYSIDLRCILAAPQ